MLVASVFHVLGAGWLKRNYFFTFAVLCDSIIEDTYS
jgi:hypothetical protein